MTKVRTAARALGLAGLLAVAVGAPDAAENVGASCAPAPASVLWLACWASSAAVSPADALSSSAATSEYDASLATVS